MTCQPACCAIRPLAHPCLWPGQNCGCLRHQRAQLQPSPQAAFWALRCWSYVRHREHKSPDLLPLVNSYRHLRITQGADGSIQLESNQRIGSDWSAFREATRKVFRSKRISVDKKAVYLRGLVMAKLTVGAGAWPPLKEGESRAFRGCVINMYRQLLCLPMELLCARKWV